MSANIKCDNELIERVRAMIEEGLSWPKIAKASGVAETSLANYRKVGHNSYNADFAAMVEESREIAGNKTKAGQMVQSRKHTLKRTIWEPRQVDTRSMDKKEKRQAGVRSVEKNEERTRVKNSPPPQMPPSWFPKDYLIVYADQVLDLELYKSMSVNKMRAECLLRIKELTVTVKVKTVIEQEVDPSAQAVKNVLTNTGDEKKRWTFEEEMRHGVDDPLTKLLAEIGGIKRGLPGEEEIPEFKNQEAEDG